MKRLVKYPRGFERRLSTLSTEELHNAIIEYRKIVSSTQDSLARRVA